MIHLKQISQSAPDCFVDFSVYMSRPYTLKEFIREITTFKEHGFLYIYSSEFRSITVEYDYNKFEPTEDFKRVENRLVNKVSASGGWGRIDYYIDVKEF
jgi:hypothetical protein